jgi:hypothetical protein
MRLWSLVGFQARELVRQPMFVFTTATMVAIGAMLGVLVPGMKVASDAEGPHVNILLILMSAFMIGWQIPAHGLAEEKEKRTWQAAMLTPIRPVHMVLARAVLGALVTVPVATGALLLTGQLPAYPGLLVLGAVPILWFAIAGGTLVGLLAPEPKYSAFGGTPVMLALIFGATMPWREFAPHVWSAQTWLPTRPMFELLRAGMVGADDSLLQHALVMSGYAALLMAACVVRLRQLTGGARQG